MDTGQLWNLNKEIPKGGKGSEGKVTLLTNGPDWRPQHDEMVKVDALVKSRKMLFSVIPAKAGIQ